MNTLLSVILSFLFWSNVVHCQFESLCFPPDQFRFSVFDKISGTTFRWDLSTLCKPSGSYQYKGFGTEGQTFIFNVGGNASIPCADFGVPRYPMYESWGTAIQMFQDGRGINPRDDCLSEDGTPCVDWTYGGDLCCSPRHCEVVALEPAVFTPMNKQNLATGGVLLTHAGYPASDNDLVRCPYQADGLRRLRTFELYMACNTSGSANDLVVTGYNEGDDGENGQYCRFQVYVSTLAACGIPDPLPTPPPESASDAINRLLADGTLASRGSQFGYVILGGLLTIAFQYAYEHRVTLHGMISKGSTGSLSTIFAGTKTSTPPLIPKASGYGATSL